MRIAIMIFVVIGLFFSCGFVLALDKGGYPDWQEKDKKKVRIQASRDSQEMKRDVEKMKKEAEDRSKRVKKEAGKKKKELEKNNRRVKRESDKKKAEARRALKEQEDLRSALKEDF